MRLLIAFLLLIPCCVFAADATGVIALAVDDGGIFGEWALKILQWGSSVIGVASVITAVTPTKKDNAALAVFKAILQGLAMNVGHAKDDPPKRL